MVPGLLRKYVFSCKIYFIRFFDPIEHLLRKNTILETWKSKCFQGFRFKDIFGLISKTQLKKMMWIFAHERIHRVRSLNRSKLLNRATFEITFKIKIKDINLSWSWSRFGDGLSKANWLKIMSQNNRYLFKIFSIIVFID